MLALAFLNPRNIQEPADLLPYMAIAALLTWRGKKVYAKFEVRQERLLDQYEVAVNAALAKPRSRKSELFKTRNQFRRKLFFLRNDEMLSKAVKTINRERTSVANLEALEDLFQVSGVRDLSKVIDRIGAEVLDSNNERGRLYYYAQRLGATETPRLKALCLKAFRGDQKLLAVTQATIAETAFTDVTKRQDPPVDLDLDLATRCGLDHDVARRIVDEYNTPPEPEVVPEAPVKEDWLQELESKVEEESGPVDFASDNPAQVDAFGNPKRDPSQVDEEQDEGKMLTVECNDCGYTMFIAKNREFKFFGPTFTCPNCQAPKSRFSVTEKSADDQVPATSSG